MKLKHLLVSLLASAVAFTSCQDEEKDFGLPEVKITTSALSFNQDLASSTLTVTSTRDWMVSTAADWVAIYPSKGKANTETVVTITVLENETYNRKAAVKFDIGYDYKTLTISQEGPMGEKTNGSGTISDPYTVKGVLDYIQTLGTDESPDVVYVAGKIATITGVFTTQHGNAEFTIKDANSEVTDVFTAYRVKYLGNKAWTANDDQISIEDDVIVAGKVYNYGGNKPETVSGTGYIYSHNGKTAGGGGGEGGGTPAGTGTLTDPYNVAGAVNAVKDLTWTSTTEYQTTDMVYVKGKISRIADNGNYAASGTYGNATFYIADYSEGGEVEAEFYAFRILYLGNKKYTSGQTDIKVGDEVILHGKLMNYRGNTPETVNNSAYLYSLNGDTGEGGGGGEGGGDEAKGTGTLEDPFNPAGAVNAVKDLTWTSNTEYESTDEVYVKGKISEIANNGTYSASGTYGNASFSITETGTTTGTKFTAYRILYLGNVKYEAGQTDIKVGDEVVICGKLMNYRGNTPETVAGAAYLYSLTPADPSEGGGDDGGDSGNQDPVDGESFNVATVSTSFTADTDATYGTGFTWTSNEGVKVAYYKYQSNTNPINTSTDHIRVYKTSVLVLTAPQGRKFAQIVLNCTDPYNNKNYANDMTVLEGGTGTMSANQTAKTVTWTGSASKIVAQATEQVRVKNIDVTLEEIAE